MTLQALFESVTNNSFLLIYFFIVMPILAALFGFLSGKDGYQDPWKYIFSVLVYLVCIPGIFSVLLCIYSMFFERQNLLEVNILVYFLPILSMVSTLVIIRQRVDLISIPGFDKISGLVLVIAAAFILIMLLQKTRIWVVFVASIWHLVAVIAILIFVIKIGFDRLGKKKVAAVAKQEESVNH